MQNSILIVKHAKNEGPGSIEGFFKNTAWSLQTIELSEGAGLPHDFEGISALVLMGGPMNVYEEKNTLFLKMRICS